MGTRPRWAPAAFAAVVVACGLVASPARARGDERRGERPPSLEELRKDLRAPRPESRRVAVERLAELGTREAYASVLAALDDPEGMVADEAQLQVASARDARLVADLCGPAGLASREPRVRERVAEALGRLEVALDARVIVRALPGADPETARLLAWSAERLAAGQRIAGDREDLARALDDLAGRRGDARVRGAAILALGKLDARAAEARVNEAVEAREPELRCAAARAAWEWTEMAQVALAQRLAADPETSVRAGVVELLARTSGRDSARLLADRLEREERSRVRWRILAHLRALSGEDHGFDASAWRGWAARREGGVSTGDVRERGIARGETGVALAGLDLTSDRAAFLIDLSGSMWGTKVAGRTRKEIVDGELRRALEGLPRSARFNVIPYTGTPHPWEKRLVPAETAQVRRAIGDFERCHHSGRGDAWSAIEVALQDPETDAIVILCDGVPTGGPHWDLGLIVDLLLERNRFRNAAFDVVLVDAPRGRQAQWTRLARESAGRSVAVDLSELARGGGGIPPRKEG